MQYIYTMKGLGKVHPPDAVVLKDIWLSFLPGAKIGVLGLNGAGKSSLLKIMAGEDTEFIGEAFPADGITVGFLHQEPQLDPDKDVKGNVEEGVAATKALLDRYDELNMKLGEDLSPEADGQGARGAGPPAGPHRRGQRLGDRLAARAGDGRAALSAARCRRHARCRAASAAASRCAGCCSSRPICCCSTSRPTTSTPSRWRGSSASSRNTRAPSSP